jgi:hypothetical protein
VDLDVVFWLVIAGIVGVWLFHAVPEPAEALGGIFGFREVLWPSGVQEDDDAHWSWARALRERASAEPPPEPELEDAAPAPLESPEEPTGFVGGGRYEVRAPVHGQVRSAPRARS